MGDQPSSEELLLLTRKSYLKGVPVLCARVLTALGVSNNRKYKKDQRKMNNFEK